MYRSYYYTCDSESPRTADGRVYYCSQNWVHRGLCSSGTAPDLWCADAPCRAEPGANGDSRWAHGDNPCRHAPKPAPAG